MTTTRSTRRGAGGGLARALGLLGLLGLGGAAAIAAGGCGTPSFEETVTVAPTDVRGTVGGIVVDAADGAALEGIVVTVRGGATVATATTGADGSFVAGADDPAKAGKDPENPDTLPELPAGGSLYVDVDGLAAGYSSATLLTALPVAAGDVPLQNPAVAIGPIGLLPLTLDVVVQVLRDDGLPFEGVEVRATVAVGWVNLQGGAPAPGGAWLQTATTATGGYATFSGLPAAGTLPPTLSDLITFTVPAQDLNGDGFNEFEATTVTRSARSLPPGLVILTMNSIDLPLQVVASNVPALVTGGAPPGSLPPVLGTMDAVQLVFNQPIEPSLLAVTVTDEEGTGFVMPMVPPPSGVSNIVIIQAPGAWLNAFEYNVVVHAVTSGSNPPRTYDGTGAFFTPPTVPTAASAARDPSDPNLVHVTFTEPVGVTAGGVWALGGASCPVFVQYDLNFDGDTSDTNEYMGPDCTVTLFSNEPDPPGPAGASGFTTRAYFFVPGGFPASTVSIELRFSRAAAAGSVLRTAAGTLVPDQPMVSVF